MGTRFEIRQYIYKLSGNRFEVVSEFPDFAERTARLSFNEIATDNPKGSFMLVRVQEEVLSHSHGTEE